MTEKNNKAWYNGRKNESYLRKDAGWTSIVFPMCLFLYLVTELCYMSESHLLCSLSPKTDTATRTCVRTRARAHTHTQTHHFNTKVDHLMADIIAHPSQVMMIDSRVIT